MKNIAIAMFIIIVLLNGTILQRSTFEAWEGSLDWTTNTGGNGDVRTAVEDPNNDYQTQSHGAWSLRIQDPNNNSYANAYKTFSNSATEYMTEFYFWIKSDHTAPIDSFPLCVLWNIPALGLPAKTDIALVIDTLDNPPNGGIFTIHVQDADSIHHNEAIIDSTDRWYKIQIYRHISGSDTVVTLYFDGDSIDTYVPMNKDKVSNKISLGTTSADSLADGEVFYDDIIISTPPVGEHPRLLFDSVYVENILRPRRNDYETNPLGTSYGEIWDSLEALAEAYCTTDYISYPWPDEDGKDTLHYSFHQLGPHSGENNPEYWLSPLRQIKVWLTRLAFVGLVDDSTKYVNRAKGILNSLANWQSFLDHSAKIWSDVRYALLGTGEIAYGIALAYDWLYNDLSNYEKLNIQNTLINLAVNQLYLQALYYDEPGPPSWPLSYANGRAQMFGGGMGLACLSLDSVGLDNELQTAQIKIDSIVCKCTLDVCNDGAYNEGASYATYAVKNITVFLEAEDSLDYYVNTKSGFLKNNPKWRIYCMLPGAEQVTMRQEGSGPQWDVAFSDYDKWGGVWHPGECKIASILQNGNYQWFQKQRFYIEWKDLLFFLWMDKDLDTIPPDTFALTRVHKNGWATTRTGWSTNDYLLAFKGDRTSPKSHFQAEQGNFAFGGKARWLIGDIGFSHNHYWRNIQYQNALAINEDTTYAALWRFEKDGNLSYYISSSYVYFENVDTSYVELKDKKWTRKIVFIPSLASFAVSDYAIKQNTINTLNWYLHSYIAPTIDTTQRQITISYQNGPNLQCYIVEPDSINVDTALLDTTLYFMVDTDKFYLREIKVGLPITDTISVVAGFASYNNVVEVSEINAKNFNGVFMKNDSGSCAILFGVRDSIEGGKYEVSVTDSLLNVVCDLVPDTNYLVITKKGTDNETIDTLPTNDVGILSFKLNGSGDWKVIITLARVTGSIKINNDSTYCNMPFVELNLEVTNPLDSNSVDSMRIWQDYTVNDTLQTDSTGWIPFDSTYFWYLRQGEGTNIVYAQFMGNGWNESIEYCDSIVFDKTLPTGSFVIDGDSTFTNTSSVTLMISMKDSSSSMSDTSGMSKMRFGHKYLKNLVRNSAFDSSGNWVYDNAIYLDTLKLFKIPLQTIGNYFYQAIAPESLADFVNDTLLLWIDLVSDGFVGDARVAFQYIYSPDTAIRGTHPYGDSITIPEGTNATVSHYNLYSYFKYYPDPPAGETFIEARIGVFANSALKNSGKLFIDNLRLDVVSPADDYTRFEDYDTLKNDWTLSSGNGVRKVYGQFSDGAGNETNVSFDSIIVDTTKPARRISYPQNGQTISDTITITGWAHDSLDDPPHFKQYELQHQAQMSAIWYGNDPDSISYTPKYPIQVGQGQKPVDIGDWNTYQVNDGWYNLKLTVADSAGNSRDTTISVRVSNEGDGEGGFSGFSNYLYGLAAGNQVYIGEFNTGKIYQYNTNYELIDTFKLVDSAGIGFPLAMAIDDSGKLWVANTNSHLISKFTSQGSLLLRFAGGFSLPSGFAFDNSGNVWVSDRLHHKIKKFNQDGDSLFAFGTQGSEKGEIDKPIGIAFFDNRIYIADSKNKRVSVFDTLGDFIEVIADSAGLQMPFGLVIDSSGCLFVSDFLGNQVIEFDPYGNQLFKIDSILDSPTGLALSPDANILYVSDTRNKRVLAFQVRGEPPVGGGPQAYGDSYFDRLMFDVYPSLSAKQMNIRLQGFTGRKISLKVYDVTGRLIKTFYDNQMIKANQSISWDCKDDINRKLANGVYFIRLETEDYKETKKVILLE